MCNCNSLSLEEILKVIKAQNNDINDLIRNCSICGKEHLIPKSVLKEKLSAEYKIFLDV